MVAVSDDKEPHVRRKRYRGSHPRSFSEKYKERQPEKYQRDLERVLARGDTPAGSHRPICVTEILGIMAPKPGETAVDATLGYGGHARLILAGIVPGGRLYGFDRDPLELARTTERLAAQGFGEASFTPVHANFSRLREVLDDACVSGVDMVLADLGVSSMQIDDPERGFSWKRKGPLDMRMDQGRGVSAREYLSSVSESTLRGILEANADEEQAGAVARAVCLRRGRLESTRDLAEAICSAFPDLTFKDPAMTKILRRAFQAIRIEVNGEFAALEALLADLPACLKPGGRAAFLCFHSGEDRRLEASLQAGLESGIYAAVSTGPIRPGREEQYANPRSSSAKLRWAVRA
jgi:16S rRNA (cytosine1402-N4)-methyltransferase